MFDDEDITDLQHGSGLGIWLARWVAERPPAASSTTEPTVDDRLTSASAYEPMTC